MDAEKQKLREGDSARARFFRKKDEIFGDGSQRLNEFTKLAYEKTDESGLKTTESGKKVLEELMPLYKEIRTCIDELNKAPDDEALLTRGVTALEKLRDAQDAAVAKANAGGA